VLERDVPDLVHGVLRRLRDAEPCPDRTGDPDAERHAVALDGVDARLDVRPDDREVLERRIQDLPLEAGVAMQEEPEAAPQDEEEREQGEEPVVRDQRRQIPRLVVAELLVDGDWKGDARVALLVCVDPSNDPLDHRPSRRKNTLCEAYPAPTPLEPGWQGLEERDKGRPVSSRQAATDRFAER